MKGGTALAVAGALPMPFVSKTLAASGKITSARRQVRPTMLVKGLMSGATRG